MASYKFRASDPTGSCTRTNMAGLLYEEFGCLYPALGKHYYDFEYAFDPSPVRLWMAARPWLPIVAVVAYGALIVLGQRYFASRPAWNVRRFMAAWNALLSVFSFVGFLRVVPAFVHLWKTYSWMENFCIDPESHYASGSTGLWLQLFSLSKLPELIDTFFIVVHKKNLIFLHWYHHVSVLLYCWYSYVNKVPVGIIFACMNYFVHAIMYFYYFLMAAHYKPKWFNPVIITLFQISQMIVGVGVTSLGLYVVLVRKPALCWLTPHNIFAALLMYGSYLALFCHFFWKRYFGKKKSIKANKPNVAVAVSQRRKEE